MTNEIEMDGCRTEIKEGVVFSFDTDWFLNPQRSQNISVDMLMARLLLVNRQYSMFMVFTFLEQEQPASHKDWRPGKMSEPVLSNQHYHFIVIMYLGHNGQKASIHSNVVVGLELSVCSSSLQDDQFSSPFILFFTFWLFMLATVYTAWLLELIWWKHHIMNQSNELKSA